MAKKKAQAPMAKVIALFSKAPISYGKLTTLHRIARKAYISAFWAEVDGKKDAWKVGEKQALDRTFNALCGFVATRASNDEIGSFASYIAAAYNADFQAHLKQKLPRVKRGIQGMPSLDDIISDQDGDCWPSLSAIAKAHRRLAKAATSVPETRAPKKKAA